MKNQAANLGERSSAKKNVEGAEKPAFPAEVPKAISFSKKANVDKSSNKKKKKKKQADSTNKDSNADSNKQKQSQEFKSDKSHCSNIQLSK